MFRKLSMRSLALIVPVFGHTMWAAPMAWADDINPFARPVDAIHTDHTGDAPQELQLRAVMPAMRGALANINGQVLAIGDAYLNYTLLAVHDRSVALGHGDQRLELQLQSGLGRDNRRTANTPSPTRRANRRD